MNFHSNIFWSVLSNYNRSIFGYLQRRRCYRHWWIYRILFGCWYIDWSIRQRRWKWKETLLTSTITQTKPILKRESSIRKALEFGKDHPDSTTGLLKYFSQGTKEDGDTYWKREEERTVVNLEKKDFKKKSVDMEKKLYKRELARVRQQRKRDRIKGREINQGVRSPGGRKRKVSQISLLELN